MADVTVLSSSTSSSSPSVQQSSGSGQSATEVSSTCSTQDVEQDCVDGEEVESKPVVWGRLLALSSSYKIVDLVINTLFLGRDEKNDIVFDKKDFKNNVHFMTLSSKHFQIYREFDNGDDNYTVYVKDLSSNGTFINDVKIGKNSIRVLNDGDEISLSGKTTKAYIYKDFLTAKLQRDQLPEAFQAKYILSKVLGSGACGEVKLAFTTSTCERVAVKIISKKNFSMSNKLKSSMMEEVNILRALDHPCIIRIQDVFDSDEALYIVLELVEGGELFERVVAMKKFPEPTAKLLFYQMVVAVKYLHDKGITHRDLKPENVLLASSDNETLIKITDFGLSKFVGENSLMRTLCGTPNYLAPEVLRTGGLGGYDKMVDCWSLGCMLFICLGGYPPFSDEYIGRTIQEQILTGSYSFPKPCWECTSKEGIDLIKRFLTIDPKKRISVSEALEHPWLQDDKMKAKAESLMTMLPPRQLRSAILDDGPVAKKPKLSA